MKRYTIAVVLMMYFVFAKGQSQSDSLWYSVSDSLWESVKIPSNYKLFVKLNAPTDLKWGIPGEILIDESHKYFIISYDYKPTHIDLYSMSDWKLIKRINIKGYVQLFNSYFYSHDNAVYIDKGMFKNNYIRVDLTTYDQTPINCDKAPYGCGYGKYTETKTDHYPGDISVSKTDWYVIKYDNTKAEIYLKKR